MNNGKRTLSRPTHQDLDKVRGSKIYSTDFRPGDNDVGWPEKFLHAVIVRSQRPNARFLGLNHACIPYDLEPDHLVSTRDIVAAGVKLSATWYEKKLFLSEGDIADYVGQPVGIAFFESWITWRRFKEWIRTDNTLVEFGEKGTQLEEQDVKAVLSPILSSESRATGSVLKSVNYVRKSCPNGGDDVFSHYKYPNHDPSVPGAARDAVYTIENELFEAGANVVSGAFSSETNDTMFMEPECGLAYLDQRSKNIELWVGTQSPESDRDSVGKTLADVVPGLTVQLRSCPPGGGFGGRDLSRFPIVLSIAAAVAPSNTPVRLCYDRFEQFQVGIKRHAFASESRLYFSSQGEFLAYFTKMVFNGGGTKNLTSAVTGLAAVQAAGPYEFPASSISSTGYKTKGATSGSMRGFGIPQATLAIESLVDEAARSFDPPRDPIELRKGQCFNAGSKDVTGYTLRYHVGTEELCDLASKEGLWVDRHRDKKLRDTLSVSYGVGFACCAESYGTSQDAVFDAVEISDEGLEVKSSVVDMGQGSTASVMMATREYLGVEASRAAMGLDQLFEEMGMVKTESGNVPAPDKYETPKLGSGSSASMTAFFHLHAIREASRILFEHSVIPAAAIIWGNSTEGIRWDQNGNLTAKNQKPIAWCSLVDVIRESKLPTGSMVHTYYRGEYARGQFKHDGNRVIIGEFDGLALKVGKHYSAVPRVTVDYPGEEHKNSRRSLYAAAGHIVAIEVNRRNGKIKVVDVVSLLDPGVVHNESLLRGQVEGGLVMGLGMALKEQLPIPLDGVSPGWNLNRYQVPRITDVPIANLSELRIVPFTPSSSSPVVHKGIAEATMTTIPAAVCNAVAHAIDRRITQVPLTPERVLRALEE